MKINYLLYCTHDDWSRAFISIYLITYIVTLIEFLVKTINLDN